MLLLHIRTSSANAERDFSVCSNVMTVKRNRLSVKMIEILTFLKINELLLKALGLESFNLKTLSTAQREELLKAVEGTGANTLFY